MDSSAFAEGELEKDATVVKFATVQKEGERNLKPPDKNSPVPQNPITDFLMVNMRHVIAHKNHKNLSLTGLTKRKLLER